MPRWAQNDSKSLPIRVTGRHIGRGLFSADWKERAFIWYQIKISTVLESNWPGAYLPPAFWVFLLVRK
ncbi:hypothetical protein ACROYT_G009426 [Oculina patagonica]